jgi:preprotein translocase subunit SecA
MLDFLNKALTGILGNKSSRDMKSLNPRVPEINAAYEKLKNLSHDELRAKTLEFRLRIAEDLKDIDDEAAGIRQRIDSEADMDPQEKDELFKELDDLKKKRNEKLEKTLDAILPEAFAVMKDTARRFKDNKDIRVKANQRDRDLAVDQDFVDIEGDEAVYHNSWSAAGVPITWDMLHYDVQLIGGMVLHSGKIAEMATGEGKTLVSTLPAYLNALAGQGVHIVTVNDYLARRDCEWMAPIYEFLGIKVDCIEYYEPNSEDRKNAYLADITYGTNNEFGFDYLRDNMARGPEDIVQRAHHFAMVDEVDSVLIDDARTPLIISGPTPKGDIHEFDQMKPRVERLVQAQRQYVNKALTIAKDLLSRQDKLTKEEEKEAGTMLMRAYRGLPKNKALIKFLSETGMRATLQKWENYYLQEQMKNMPEVDQELYFVIDEKNNSIEMAEKGIELITDSGEDPEFFVMPDVGSRLADIERTDLSPNEKLQRKDELMQDFAVKSERIHTINQLLKAYTLFERDVEYIIADGKVKIVDEQTGRVLDGRRYSDGLHQAIESKENVAVEAATQTYATITLQNYFRMFHKLCGMTGTAETEAAELWSIYKLDVVVIPTNRPIARDDKQDLVYKTKREKYNSVIDEITDLVNKGRPVLVGTTSVEISELLSRMLKLRGIKHNVLNAKQHQREAEIVAEAGYAGTVTIATNMAGRGTDIKLGPGVKDAGGLAIIGTERHESRRVDRQLRGRAGRQGDPGSSQFYVSLEDDLMRLFGSDRMAKYMDRFGYKEGEVIQHSLITKSIERAQKKVEQNNFGIRKRLLEYDDVMNSQREVIYKRRRNALYGDRLELDINQMIEDVAHDLVTQFHGNGDYQGLELETLRLFAAELPFTQTDFNDKKVSVLQEEFAAHLHNHYKRKSATIAERAFPIINQIFQEQGDRIENIVVPFSDGMRGMNVLTPLRKAYETGAREIVRSFEKMITLSLIDDAWKEHLRELDELRTSVQNAVYEQKDPLLIYKFESFSLFETMLGKINKDILNMLFKGHIHTDNGGGEEQPQQRQQPRQQPQQVREARPMPKQPEPKLKASRSDIYSGPAPGQPMAEPKTEPVRVGEKVGRNDLCPCGSGKKYKNCHGKNAE